MNPVAHCDLGSSTREQLEAAVRKTQPQGGLSAGSLRNQDFWSQQQLCNTHRGGSLDGIEFNGSSKVQIPFFLDTTEKFHLNLHAVLATVTFRVPRRITSLPGLGADWAHAFEFDDKTEQGSTSIRSRDRRLMLVSIADVLTAFYFCSKNNPQSKTTVLDDNPSVNTQMGNLVKRVIAREFSASPTTASIVGFIDVKQKNFVPCTSFMKAFMQANFEHFANSYFSIGYATHCAIEAGIKEKRALGRLSTHFNELVSSLSSSAIVSLLLRFYLFGETPSDAIAESNDKNHVTQFGRYLSIPDAVMEMFRRTGDQRLKALYHTISKPQSASRREMLMQRNADIMNEGRYVERLADIGPVVPVDLLRFHFISSWDSTIVRSSFYPTTNLGVDYEQLNGMIHAQIRAATRTQWGKKPREKNLTFLQVAQAEPTWRSKCHRSTCSMCSLMNYGTGKLHHRQERNFREELEDALGANDDDDYCDYVHDEDDYDYAEYFDGDHFCLVDDQFCTCPSDDGTASSGQPDSQWDQCSNAATAAAMSNAPQGGMVVQASSFDAVQQPSSEASFDLV